MDGIWAGVRERVLAVRDAPHWREVFGADWLGTHGHGFRLEPVLTEAEVAAVERRLGAELPAEYRAFLRQVGAGGAGPDYGLFPRRPPAPDAEPGQAGPPFRPEATAELDAHEAREPRAADYDDGDGGDGGDALRRAYAAWERRRDQLEAALTEGTLYLGERGCAYSNLLVVTGPERGTVWEDVRAVGEGCGPCGAGAGTGSPSPSGTSAGWSTRSGRPPRGGAATARSAPRGSAPTGRPGGGRPGRAASGRRTR
ncbi:SMI1/KNR4 family protein [Streptomyces sp. G45]|uniref:SMI1/KNR4 family protein n=1 Tax=Streptomyces sp. G45 TaxID=3406627 RepID=UPI003C1F5303